VWQRCQALSATATYLKADESENVNIATSLDRTLHCLEYALGLSARRWSVLSVSVLLSFVAELLALLCCLTLWSDEQWHWSTCHWLVACPMQHLHAITSPLSLFGASFCFFDPLMYVLVEGALANMDLRARAAQLLAASRVTSAQQGAGESKSYTILVELPRTYAVRWPIGRELGLLEPLVLLGLFGACATALWH